MFVRSHSNRVGATKMAKHHSYALEGRDSSNNKDIENLDDILLDKKSLNQNTSVPKISHIKNCSQPDFSIQDIRPNVQAEVKIGEEQTEISRITYQDKQKFIRKEIGHFKICSMLPMKKRVSTESTRKKRRRRIRKMGSSRRIDGMMSFRSVSSYSRQTSRRQSVKKSVNIQSISPNASFKLRNGQNLRSSVRSSSTKSPSKAHQSSIKKLSFGEVMQLRDPYPFKKADQGEETQKLIELKLAGNVTLKSASQISNDKMFKPKTAVEEKDIIREEEEEFLLRSHREDTLNTTHNISKEPSKVVLENNAESITREVPRKNTSQVRPKTTKKIRVKFNQTNYASMSKRAKDLMNSVQKGGVRDTRPSFKNNADLSLVNRTRKSYKDKICKFLHHKKVATILAKPKLRIDHKYSIFNEKDDKSQNDDFNLDISTKNRKDSFKSKDRDLSNSILCNKFFNSSYKSKNDRGSNPFYKYGTMHNSRNQESEKGSRKDLLNERTNSEHNASHTPSNKKKKTFYTETVPSRLYYPKKATIENPTEKLLKLAKTFDENEEINAEIQNLNIRLKKTKVDIMKSLKTVKGIEVDDRVKARIDRERRKNQRLAKVNNLRLRENNTVKAHKTRKYKEKMSLHMTQKARSNTKKNISKKEFMKRKKRMIRDIEFDYKMEDDKEYIEKRLLKQIQHVDAATEIQKYEDWLLSTNNKKLLGFKFQHIKKQLSDEMNETLAEYLKI
ncbi:unnamed protein product [Moneuplotes crassus]|uniref:Uncharacterized protein n=1 Tax=Euplotes crassus TaxID=5936 RepID=A0AAD1UAI2_EUPCR|nr:unnamed protein product [Moneuplotes crassus]